MKMMHYKVFSVALLASLVSCEPPVQGYNYQAPRKPAQSRYNSPANSYLPPTTANEDSCQSNKDDQPLVAPRSPPPAPRLLPLSAPPAQRSLPYSARPAPRSPPPALRSPPPAPRSRSSSSSSSNSSTSSSSTSSSSSSTSFKEGLSAPSNNYLPPSSFNPSYSNSGSHYSNTGTNYARTGSGYAGTGSGYSGATGGGSGYAATGSGYNGASGHDHDHHGHGNDNEVPKSYEFGYSVKDAQSGNDYGRQESSDGNVVRGEYRVQLPDGRTQIVTYHADWQTGFHADVRYEGEARYPEPTNNHGQQQGGAGGYNYNAPSDFRGSLNGFQGNNNAYKPSTAYGPPGYH